MSSLLESVTALLDEAELRYELHCDDDKERIDMGRMSNDPPYSLQIQVFAESSVVNLMGGAECFLPENIREQACVMLNEYNYIYMHKAFIDPNDGQLMAQRCLDVDGGALNKEVLIAAMGAVHSAIKHNYDALMSLRYSGTPQNTDEPPALPDK